ncbi:MAG: DUF3638 domain-containing protein, partial [Candidatus Fonsibacter sp.]
MMTSKFVSHVWQLNIGEGRSNMILPMLCVAIAYGHQLLRIMVLHSLVPLYVEHIRESLGVLLGRRLYLLPFDRQRPVTKESVAAMLQQLQECRVLGGTLLMTPEATLSLQLKLRECCLQAADSIDHYELARHFA